MKKFLQGRLGFVKRLCDSELPVEYADVVLILCSVLSACASWRWPGDRRIDQKRFVELLIKSPEADKFKTSWVSVPCLIYDGKIDKNKTPLGKVASSLEEISSDKVDLSFEDAVQTYRDVEGGVKTLRQYCYATLIYTQLRCGYSHEYFTNRPFFPPCPDEIDNSPILYRHRLFAAENKIITIASFSINYLIELAEYHVNNLPREKSAEPREWWIVNSKTGQAD